ncbi:MAG: PD-(D/E)XK nuclease family protein [Armatimonadota bacterium]
MRDWQPAPLSWSFSKKIHFDSCKRFYFLHRFWGQDIRARWQLYEMRNITTLIMLRGSVVHSVISEALESLKTPNPMDYTRCKGRITEILREKYKESYFKMWKKENLPIGKKQSQITNLLEHYYNMENTKERAKEMQESAWQAVHNLIQSDLWQSISSKCNLSEAYIEKENSFPNFNLDGILVYAKLDFASKIDGVPTIIDWKTGKHTETDRQQLIFYSIFAKEKWGWNPEETKLCACYLLPDMQIDEFYPSKEDIEYAKNQAKENFEEMLKLEPAPNEPANIENFPITDDLFNCRICRYQGICEGGKRIENKKDWDEPSL